MGELSGIVRKKTSGKYFVFSLEKPLICRKDMKKLLKKLCKYVRFWEIPSPLVRFCTLLGQPPLPLRAYVLFEWPQEVYLGNSQTSMMDLLCEVVKAVIYFHKKTPPLIFDRVPNRNLGKFYEKNEFQKFTGNFL